MGYYDFNKDLLNSRQAIKEVVDLLEKRYNAEILEIRDDYKYDIRARIKGKEVTFEIKEDFMTGDTGNVAVEFSCRGKPSGIENTESVFYIYKLHRPDGIQFVLHPTKILRNMIKNNLYFRVVNGGDKGSDSLNYLFKYNIFIRNGKILPYAS